MLRISPLQHARAAMARLTQTQSNFAGRVRPALATCASTQQAQQQQKRGLHSHSSSSSNSSSSSSSSSSRSSSGRVGSSSARAARRTFSTYPEHKVVNMPSLSPTMEVGSIAKWSLKEGDKFEAGMALCEVETDKATVTFDATDDGYIAKILVGTGEIKVGQPIMVTVEDKESVSKFASFALPASASAPTPAAAPAPAPKAAAPTPAAASPAAAAAPSSSSSAAPRSSGARVFASPLARKLARDANIDISLLQGSGPNGRIIAADVTLAPASAAVRIGSAGAPGSLPSGRVTVTVPGVYADFDLSELGRAVASRYVSSKMTVPHYYLSVEVNVAKLARLREDLNAGKEDGFSLMDFLVKAAALAVKQVPDANASWMETFVRRYDQVDVNIVMGAGNGVITPVIRDVGKKGLKALSKEIGALDESLFADEEGLVVKDAALLAPGTISVHNLGMFGVKSASPIILPPQAVALAFGAVVDTVLPRANTKVGEDNWVVEPVMIVTISCDHRVIDGAVAAQYISAFKALVENPAGMIL